MTRLVLLGGFLLLLVGCSSFSFVYSRIDWLAPFYVDDYVALDRAQRAVLKRELLELRAWHCGTQLTRYAAWAQGLERDLLESRLTPERVAGHYQAVRGALRDVVAAASPGARELFLALSPQQYEQFFRRLERENDEFAATFVNPPLARAQQAYAKRMQKQLREWVGGLTPEQERYVARWSERVAPEAGDRLLARRAWQMELRRLLHDRDRPDFTYELAGLLTHPDEVKPDRYQAVRDAYRAEMVALLSDIARSLTPHQRERLLGRASTWRRDFERMACVKAAQPEGAVAERLGKASDVSETFLAQFKTSS